MKLLYVVPDASFFWSHRRALAAAAREEGWQVSVAAPPGPGEAEIRGAGFAFHPIELDRSVRPWDWSRGWRDLRRLYRRLTPDLVHHVSMRAVLSGWMAARSVPDLAVLNHLTGLGYVFTSGSRLLRWGVERVYRRALQRPRSLTVFQNRDDRELFLRRGLVAADKAELVLGSGVDCRRYRPSPEPEGMPVILFASRLLADKGILELVEAARLLHARGAAHRLVVAGRPDPSNPTSVGESRLRSWHAEGLVEWLGWCDDVAPLLAACHIACLPSYREGLSLFLLEAAASGRPLVATDVPGNREIALHGVTGLLVPARDPAALADALEELLGDPERRAALGRSARQRAEERFSQERIHRQTLELYRRLSDRGQAQHA